MTGADRIRTLVLEDHAIVRAGLVALLSRSPNIEVVAECGTSAEAVAAVKEHLPDLAIVDLILGNESALPLLRRLLQYRPELRILVLSMHDEMIYAQRAIKAGAHGYVMKGVSPEELREAISAVMSGGFHVSARIRDVMLRNLSGGTEDTIADPVNKLTPGEFTTFQMIGAGLSPSQIAEKLGRSRKTVEAHRNNIRLKLEMPTSAALAHFATQWVSSNG